MGCTPLANLSGSTPPGIGAFAFRSHNSNMHLNSISISWVSFTLFMIHCFVVYVGMSKRRRFKKSKGRNRNKKFLTNQDSQSVEIRSCKGYFPPQKTFKVSEPTLQTIRLINFGIESQVQNGHKVRAFGTIEFRNTKPVQIQDTSYLGDSSICNYFRQSVFSTLLFRTLISLVHNTR